MLTDFYKHIICNEISKIIELAKTEFVHWARFRFPSNAIFSNFKFKNVYCDQELKLAMIKYQIITGCSKNTTQS